MILPKINKCCIYKITSPSSKIYIGQANNLKNRYYSYKSLACKGQRRLYASLIKHGFESHSLEVLVECEKEKLNELEIYYIKLFDTWNSSHGLNLQSGGHRGLNSDETRKILSEKLKGKGHPNWRKGKKDTWSKETLEKFSQSAKGRKRSQESIEKQRQTMKGRKRPKEFGDKISTANLKRNGHSEETKKRISEANKGREGWRQTEEQKKHLSLLFKGRPKSEETKQKLSIARKLYLERIKKVA